MRRLLNIIRLHSFAAIGDAYAWLLRAATAGVRILIWIIRDIKKGL